MVALAYDKCLKPDDPRSRSNYSSLDYGNLEQQVGTCTHQAGQPRSHLQGPPRKRVPSEDHPTRVGKYW
jgi:hypothetical protein